MIHACQEGFVAQITRVRVQMILNYTIGVRNQQTQLGDTTLQHTGFVFVVVCMELNNMRIYETITQIHHVWNDLPRLKAK